MCFGNGPAVRGESSAQSQASPKSPVSLGPAPSMEAPTGETEDERRRRLKELRGGVMSTIKTSGRGAAYVPPTYVPMANGNKSPIG